jgi:hypothetical protein
MAQKYADPADPDSADPKPQHCFFLGRAGVSWPLLYLCRPLMVIEGCPDWNRNKRANYQVSNQPPIPLPCSVGIRDNLVRVWIRTYLRIRIRLLSSVTLRMEKKNFRHIFSNKLPAGTLSSVFNLLLQR